MADAPIFSLRNPIANPDYNANNTPFDNVFSSRDNFVNLLSNIVKNGSNGNEVAVMTQALKNLGPYKENSPFKTFEPFNYEYSKGGDKTFQSIMAQDDPYVARGLGFGEMVGNAINNYYTNKDRAEMARRNAIEKETKARYNERLKLADAKDKNRLSRTEAANRLANFNLQTANMINEAPLGKDVIDQPSGLQWNLMNNQEKALWRKLNNTRLDLDKVAQQKQIELLRANAQRILNDVDKRVETLENIDISEAKQKPLSRAKDERPSATLAFATGNPLIMADYAYREPVTDSRFGSGMVENAAGEKGLLNSANVFLSRLFGGAKGDAELFLNKYKASGFDTKRERKKAGKLYRARQNPEFVDYGQFYPAENFALKTIQQRAPHLVENMQKNLRSLANRDGNLLVSQKTIDGKPHTQFFILTADDGLVPVDIMEYATQGMPGRDELPDLSRKTLEKYYERNVS